MLCFSFLGTAEPGVGGFSISYFFKKKNILIRCSYFLSCIGRSHGKSYFLFRVGKKSSAGMKTFAETGKGDELNDSGQGENDVYDIFGAPAIPTGSGRTETQFVVDGNHSLVS